MAEAKDQTDPLRPTASSRAWMGVVAAEEEAAMSGPAASKAWPPAQINILTCRIRDNQLNCTPNAPEVHLNSTYRSYPES